MKNFSQFTHRHIGSNIEEQNLMLKEIGCKSFKDLLESTLPKNILINDPLNIPVLEKAIGINYCRVCRGIFGQGYNRHANSTRNNNLERV